MGIVTANQSAFFQHSIATLLLNLSTKSAPDLDSLSINKSLKTV